MADGKFVVFVVDDDESVRASLKLLIESSGYDVVTFKSAEDFSIPSSGKTRVALSSIFVFRG